MVKMIATPMHADYTHGTHPEPGRAYTVAVEDHGDFPRHNGYLLYSGACFSYQEATTLAAQWNDRSRYAD